MASQHSNELDVVHGDQHVAEATSDDVERNAPVAAAQSNIQAQPLGANAEVKPYHEPSVGQEEGVKPPESSQHHAEPDANAEVRPHHEPNVNQEGTTEPPEPSQPHAQPDAEVGVHHVEEITQPQVYSAMIHDGYNPMSLDVDIEGSDGDSAIGESIASSKTSTRSSIYEFIEENGRTYHNYKQGRAYYLPNDEVEQDRLDLQHHLFLLTLDGKLNLAPIQNPQKVLDIGTGTGIWAMEFAAQNPSAAVIGSDLSPIQPNYVPPNCQFEVEDAEDEWMYGTKFDYIHGRALFSCFKDPKSVFQKAYDALSPGGYFEMQDVYLKIGSIDGTFEGTSLNVWNEAMVEGAKKLGRDWHCVRDYKRWFEEVGFQAVVERRFAWPMNPWAKGKKMKTIGLLSMNNSLLGVDAISLAIMTRVVGKSPDEVEAELTAVKRDIQDHSIHSYWPVYVVYGQKPL